MAIDEQTKFLGCFLTLPKSIQAFTHYIFCFLKLYIIGALALLLQMLEKSAPVRGLPSQSGRTAIVTGGSAGIGFHITKQLAILGAQVVIASKSKVEAENAITSIRRECPDAKVTFMQLDLASFKSVRHFVEEFLSKEWPLHILINNAGVMLVPYHLTEDGHEHHLQVNHLSHALLTSLLTDKMESSASEGSGARVVNVSSVVHHVASFDSKVFTEKQAGGWSYSPHNAYAVSKLAILLVTYAVSRRWAESRSSVTVNAVHPGVVNTALYRHVHWSLSWAMDILRRFFFMSPEKAALSVLHTATSPELEGVSGCYFSNCQRTGSSTLSRLPSLQEDIYTQTHTLTVGKSE